MNYFSALLFFLFVCVACSFAEPIFTVSGVIGDIAVSNDVIIVVEPYTDNNVSHVNIDTGKVIQKYLIKSFYASFSIDYKYLLFTGFDAKAYFVDAQSGVIVHEIELPTVPAKDYNYGTQYSFPEISPDGRIGIVEGEDPPEMHITLLDLLKGMVIKPLPKTTGSDSFFSKDGKKLFLNRDDGLDVYDIASDMINPFIRTQGRIYYQKEENVIILTVQNPEDSTKATVEYYDANSGQSLQTQKDANYMGVVASLLTGGIHIERIPWEQKLEFSKVTEGHQLVKIKEIKLETPDNIKYRMTPDRKKIVVWTEKEIYIYDISDLTSHVEGALEYITY